MTPLVSIGLPVYNGGQFLPEAIDSILGQDFSDFELVISDNASSDSTEEVCRDYAKRDRRISYFRLPENVGAARNYNHVYSLCSAKYFKWAAHDDVLRPEFMSRCLEVFSVAERANRRVSLVHSRSVFIDQDSSPVGPEPEWGRIHAVSRWPAVRVFIALQAMNMGSPVFGLMPRELVGKTGMIRSFAASDYVFLIEAAMLGEIVQIEEDLFLRRIHGGMSRKANTNKADVLRWFDPTSRSRISIRQRLYLEYLKSTIGLRDVSPLDRVACTAAAISGVTFIRSRVNAGRLRRNIIQSVRRLGGHSDHH